MFFSVAEQPYFFRYHRRDNATSPNSESRSLFNVYDLAEAFTAD
jgi:hypothetical protein